MTNAQQTKQARHLVPGDTFTRWQHQYTVIDNVRGVGGKGRSIMATAHSTGERVIICTRATEKLPVA